VVAWQQGRWWPEKKPIARPTTPCIGRHVHSLPLCGRNRETIITALDVELASFQPVPPTAEPVVLGEHACACRAALSLIAALVDKHLASVGAVR
jgi:hypothetical protein